MKHQNIVKIVEMRKWLIISVRHGMTETELFHWFLNGCYLIGGMSIGYWFSEWRRRRNNGKKTGTGKWDYSNRRFYGEGDQ